jgi:hypothetical protein
VQLILLSRQVEKLFDVDNPPRIGEIRALELDINVLVRDFESNKAQTKSVYEKVMYDEEVVEEIEIRFKTPLSYLEKLASSISTIQEKMARLGTLLDSSASLLRVKQPAGFPGDFIRTHGALLNAVQGWFQGTMSLTMVDTLEKYLLKLDEALPHVAPEARERLSILGKETRAFSLELDSFLLESARNAMEGNFLGRF